MSIQRFALRSVPVSPWKNGGGSTREIVSWPLDAGLDGFDWRISVATIARPGPFSAFAGVDRVITLLQGDGVVLGSADGRPRHRLDERWAPYAFSGDLAFHCRLLGGETSDFNVMTRRGRCTARVDILRGLHAVRRSPHGVSMVLKGAWEVDAENPHEPGFGEGEGVWWADEVQDITFTPRSSDDVLLAVWIDEVHA